MALADCGETCLVLSAPGPYMGHTLVFHTVLLTPQAFGRCLCP